MSYGEKFEPKITAKGTELPLLNLKGKPYLQVAHRLVWFREEKPAYGITCELVQVSETQTLARATITDENGRTIAQAHKRETEENFSDHTEKAETGAVGRALAMLGYGTQFEPDLDEGDRLADAPIQIAKKETKNANATSVKADVSGKASADKRSEGVRPTVRQLPNVSSVSPGASAVGGVDPKYPNDTAKLAERISELSAVVVAKKKATVAGLREYMTESYGQADKTKLNVEQATTFIKYLETQI